MPTGVMKEALIDQAQTRSSHDEDCLHALQRVDG